MQIASDFLEISALGKEILSKTDDANVILLKARRNVILIKLNAAVATCGI